MRTRRHLLVCLILAIVSPAVSDEPAGLNVEPLMREVQVRHQWATGDTHCWPGRCSECPDPGEITDCTESCGTPCYPVTNYYPRNVEDAVWVSLVGSIRTALQATINTSKFLREDAANPSGLDLEAWNALPKSIQTSDYPDLSEEVTAANYARLFARYGEIVGDLKYHKQGGFSWSEGGKAGGGIFSEPGTSEEDWGCADAFGAMIDEFEDFWPTTVTLAAPGADGFQPFVSDAMLVTDCEPGDAAWHGVYVAVAWGKPKISSIGALANGTTKLYLLIEPSSGGTGTHSPPVGATSTFQQLTSAPSPTTGAEVIGTTYGKEGTSTVMPTDSGCSPSGCAPCDPGELDEIEDYSCSYGWSIKEQLAIVTINSWDIPTPQGTTCTTSVCTVPIPEDNEPDMPDGEGGDGDCGDPGGCERGDDEAAGEGSSAGAGAASKSEATTTISHESVSLATGHKMERAVDLVVALPGQDFRLTREYISRPDHYGTANWGGLVGWNWSMNIFQRLYEDGDDVFLKGLPMDRSKKFAEIGTTGVWTAGGPTSQSLTQATLVVDTKTYPVWRLVSPGNFTIDYFREDAGGSGIETVGADYAGLVLQYRDAYENVHAYVYADYDKVGVGTTPRLERIVLHGTTATQATAAAVIDLTWNVDEEGAGSDYGAANGRLASASVRRPLADWALTQSVEYFYYDTETMPLPPPVGSSSFLFTANPDLGTEGDLIQVLKRVRTNNDIAMRLAAGESSGSPWRTLIWQYRYHTDSVTRWASQDRPAWLEQATGDDHQLALIINPEQIEQIARDLTEYWAQPFTVEQTATEIIETADTSDIRFMPDAKPVNIAAKLIGYTSSGVHADKVYKQWLQAGCGCGGSSPGKSLTFSYFDHPSSFDTSVHIEESVIDGGVSSVHRTVYYDLKALGPDLVHYLWIKAIREGQHPDGTSTPRTWVWQYERDATNRNLIRIFTPAAMDTASTAYVPASGVAPDPVVTPTVAPNSQVIGGLVLGYVYDSDNRISERRVSEGYEAILADMDLVERTTYVSGARNDLVSKIERFRDASDTVSADKIEVTDFVYGYHDAPADTIVASIEIQVERETESENGPAVATSVSTFQLISSKGQNEWTRTPDQALTRREFDPSTGRLVSMVRNADPAASGEELVGGDYGNISTTGWGLSGDRLRTTYELDMLGRVVQATAPGGVNSYIRRVMLPGGTGMPLSIAGVEYFPTTEIYAEIVLPHQIASLAKGEDDAANAGHPLWEQGSEPGIGFAGSATIRWFNAANKLIRMSEYHVDGTKQFDPSLASYELSGLNGENNDLARVIREIDTSGLLTKEHVWHSPSLEAGRYETIYKYDRLGRLYQTIDATHTVSQTDSYDAFDRPLGRSVGVAIDIAGELTPVNVETVEDYVFDGSASTPGDQGVGNGVLTYLRQHVDGSTRDTEMVYDWRDRLVVRANPLAPHEAQAYDNLGRVTARAIYNNGKPSGVAHTPLSERVLYEETHYSQRGIAYRRTRAVDPSNASSTLLETHQWVDDMGRPIATWAPSGPGRKTQYDALSRASTVFITARTDDGAPGTTGNYADALSVSDDQIIEQIEYQYNDLGIAEFITTRLREHDAGTLAGALTSTNSVGTYVGMLYDSAGRQTASVDFGTGGSLDEFARSSTAPTWPVAPFATDGSIAPVADALVHRKRYDRRGLLSQSISPDESITQYAYDPMRRRIADIENFTNVSPLSVTWNSGDERWQVPVGGPDGLTADDVDRVTSYVYDGASQLVKRVAHFTETGSAESVQETVYMYQVSSAGASDIDSNRMLSKVHYPKESGVGEGQHSTDAEFTVFYDYNRLGELTRYEDQNGTVHVYTRDALGRVTSDAATLAAGSDIDATILRIDVAYDGAGRITDVESFGSTGPAVNAVQLTYTPLWQMDQVKQSHDGAIGVGSVRTVDYGYSAQGVSGRNYSRHTTTVYPSGTTLTTGYGSTNSASNRISRPKFMTYLEQGAGGFFVQNKALVEYDYLGLGRIAVTDYTGIDVQLDRSVTPTGVRTAGTYPGWDRFGRVRLHQWVDGGFGPHATATGFPDRPQIFAEEYGYDDDSNRTSKYDIRDGVGYSGNSWEFTYDGLDRLQQALKGNWSGTFASTVGGQAWTLDALGNWDELLHDLTGNGQFDDPGDSNETRSHDYANQLTQIDGSPALPFTYDDAGNTLSYPAGGSDDYELKYDAWNRLVQVKIDTDIVLQQQFNGLHWRTVVQRDTSLIPDGLDQMRVLSYDASWRLVDEQVDDGWSPSPPGTFTADRTLEQFWGLRYIDDPILRRDDPAAVGGYWHITDAQFSTAALLDNNADVYERVWYTPYGEARHHWGKDYNGDRIFNSADGSALSAAISGGSVPINDGAYVVEMDYNRDGVLDSSDTPSGSDQLAVTLGQISDLDATSGPDNWIGYAGYVWEGASSLYHVRHRNYSPGLGRWMRKDPIGLSRSPVPSALFAYAHVWTRSSPLDLPHRSFAPFYGFPSTSHSDEPSPAWQSRDGVNTLAYVRSRPITGVDPTGMGWFDTLIEVLPFTSTIMNCGTLGAVPGDSKLDYGICKAYTNTYDCACDPGMAEWECSKCIFSEAAINFGRMLGLDVADSVIRGMLVAKLGESINLVADDLSDELIKKFGKDFLINALPSGLAVDAGADVACSLIKLTMMVNAGFSARQDYCKCGP